MLEGKKAVVTGCSKGIGFSLVKLLLEKGVTVAGWGQNKPEIDHPNFSFCKTDVRHLASVENAWNQTHANWNDEVDILINNSGLGYFGYFEEMPPEEFYEIFEVNVNGIFHTCRYVLPGMKVRKSGHIINISSTAGLEGMEQVGAYCGSKHAVRGISDSLYKELRPFGIKVTTVYPGSTKTDFFRNSPNIKPHDNMMSPDEVAAQIVFILEGSPNFLVNEIVFRPLNAKAGKV